MLRIEKEKCRRLFEDNPRFEDFWEAAAREGSVVLYEEYDEDSLKLFSRIYKYYRIKAKFKGNNLITPSSNSWAILTRVHEDADVFCKQFKFDSLSQGYVAYMEVASKLGFIKLNILQYKGDDIADYYGTEQDIKNDRRPDFTQALINQYVTETLHRFGHEVKVSDPRDYIHFVKATEWAISLHVGPAEYIRRVFDMWSWTGSPVTPSKIFCDYVKQYQGEIVPHKPITVKMKLGKGADRYD